MHLSERESVLEDPEADPLVAEPTACLLLSDGTLLAVRLDGRGMPRFEDWLESKL